MDGLLQKHVRRWLARFLFACVAAANAGAAHAAALEKDAAGASDMSPAALLRSKYAALGGPRGDSQFQRPLYLDSVESPRDLKGDIFALVDFPFASVGIALNNPEHWCEVMILHLNTKYCRASTSNARSVLSVSIGKKFDQPLDDAYHVDFTYRVTAATADYLAIQLTADTGPVATSDYRILLQAAPAEGGKTILHFTYSYAFGLAGKLAMQAYLATGGRGKVGFTITGNRVDGRPDYIGGVRGMVERNTMRYFLAIDSYLAAPLPEQFEKRLQSWYSASELYARQLHDVDRNAYLEMKRSEYRRQQAAK